MGNADYQARPKTEQERYAAWEMGKVDYLGQDSFANIQAKLDAAVQQQQPTAATKPPTVVSKKSAAASFGPKNGKA